MEKTVVETGRVRKFAPSVRPQAQWRAAAKGSFERNRGVVPTISEGDHSLGRIFGRTMDQMTAPASTDSVSASMRQVQAEFLKVDVMLGQTFSSMALETKDPERRGSNQRAARKAFDTVLRFMHRVKLTDDEKLFLDENLRLLKYDLELLGEIF